MSTNTTVPTTTTTTTTLRHHPWVRHLRSRYFSISYAWFDLLRGDRVMLGFVTQVCGWVRWGARCWWGTRIEITWCVYVSSCNRREQHTMWSSNSQISLTSMKICYAMNIDLNDSTFYFIFKDF
jgi:hypothetical protein